MICLFFYGINIMLTAASELNILPALCGGVSGPF
jgi:hypothetical protein